MNENDLVFETEQRMLGHDIIFNTSLLHQAALAALHYHHTDYLLRRTRFEMYWNFALDTEGSKAWVWQDPAILVFRFLKSTNVKPHASHTDGEMRSYFSDMRFRSLKLLELIECDPIARLELEEWDFEEWG